MPSPWDILGLDAPIDDLRQIKKAYAKKLRITRPDDDPAAFMALREALESAQNHAYYQQHIQAQEIQVNIEPETEIPQALPPVNEDAPLIEADHTPPTPKLDIITSDLPPAENITLTNVEEVMEDLHSLMRDPFGRTDTKRWTAIFQDTRLEAIDDLNDFEDAFLYYLLDNFGYLDGDTAKHNSNRRPRPITSIVATHIFNEMGWRDSLSRPLYMQDQLEWLRKDLDVLNKSRPIQTPADTIPGQIEKTDGNSKWIPIGIFCFYLIYLLFNALT